MRFHQLEEALRNHELFLAPAAGLEEYSRVADSSLKVLTQSVKFYLGDVNKLPLLPKDIAEVRFPFPVCAFEISYRQTVGPDGVGIVITVHKGPERTEFFLFEKLSVGWALTAQTVLLGDRRFVKTGVNRELADIAEQQGKFICNVACAVVAAVEVMNCSNVTTEEVAAPAKLNAKRARSGKPPIYSYKVLVLKRHGARAALGGTHESPRVHLRRGHIKRRATGNFWWQPCVVGEKSRGMVHKDYDAAPLIADEVKDNAPDVVKLSRVTDNEPRVTF